MSESWSPYTKRIVVLVGLILCALVLWRFRQTVRPLIIAMLLAYVLAPVVDFTARRLGMGRTLTTALVYVLLMALLITLLVIIVPALVSQARAVDVDFQSLYTAAAAWLDRPIEIGVWSFNPQTLVQQASGELSKLLSPLAANTLSFVADVASGLLQFLLVLVLSFYIVKDLPLINAFFDNLPPLNVRGDALRLRQEIGEVWNAFLRGQLILCLVIGVMVTATTGAVGLSSALFMGLLAGALEFIPNLGPVIATIPAALLALLNGSSWLPISNVGFAVLIIVLYTAIQQVENNFLVPRILGSELDLHPLAVLIAVLAGASLAGILGIFLAAPVLATLRVVGRYAYRKLQDQDPFPPQPPKPHSPPLWHRVKQWLASVARVLARQKIDPRAKNE